MKKPLTLISVLILISGCLISQKTDKNYYMSAVNDFSIALREGKAPNRLPYNPYHVEEEWNALAGDDLNFAFHMASAEGVFNGMPGIFTITLNTLTERDGECAYNVYVNDKPVGQCQKNPPTNEFCAPAMLIWTGVEIPAKAIIRVESNSYSNLRRPEMNFFEYARGRWTGIVFKTESSGKSSESEILIPSSFETCVKVGFAEINPEMNYDTPAESYYLVAGGSGLAENKDSFGYLCKQVTGDFIFETGVKLLGISGSKSSGAGIMLRKSSDTDAPFISCFIRGDGTMILKYRSDSDNSAKELNINVEGAEMIQIEKKVPPMSFLLQNLVKLTKNTVTVPGINSSLMAGFCFFRL